ncbi:MAG: BrnT family toxin, partial [bacterium]
PRIRLVERGKIRGENVYFAMGRTDSGRYLIVFFIYKKDGHAFVITARDMDIKERKLYEKK